MDPDLSTNWREHLLRHRVGPEAVLVGDERYTLVGEALIKEIRDLNFDVRHSPTGSRSPDCSHTSADWPAASVVPPKDEPSPSIRRALKYDLSRQFRFIHGELPPPPDGAATPPRE